MNHIWEKRCDFQTPLSAATVTAFIGLYLCALFGSILLLIPFLALSFCLIFWIHGVYVKNRITFTTAERYSVYLLIGIYSLFFLSLTCFCIRELVTASFSLSLLAALLFAVFLGALTVIEIRYLKQVVWSNRAPISPESVKKKLWRFLPIGGLCVLLFLLNLGIFDAWLRWDSYDYFYFIRPLSYFSITDIFKLRLANHASYACTVIYILSNGFFGGTPLSAYVVNVTVLAMSAFLFWRIVTKLFPHWKPVSHILVTCVYAFSPFMFGLVYSINLEFFLAFGMLLFFWAQIEQLPFVQTIAALLICFSKETGAVFLVAVMAVRLAIRFFGKEGRGAPVWKKLDLSLSAPIFCCGLLWLYDLLTQSWLDSNELSMETVKGEPFNAFGFSPTYIQNRLISLIFSNFTWLLLLAVIAGFSVGLLRKHKSSSPEKKLFLLEILAGMVATLIPIFLFITYNHIRYGITFVMLLLLILPEALDRLFTGCKLRATVCALLAACCFAQCFFTVDPTMYLFFDTLEKGKGKIIHTPNDILVSESTSIGVHTQYNREILYFDRAFDELLEAVNFDSKNTCLLISPEYREQTIGGHVYSEYLIMGFGYPYTLTPYYVAWDKENGERYLSSERADDISVAYIEFPDTLQDTLDAFDRVIYIQLPFRNEIFENKVLSYFSAKKIGDSSYGGWDLVAWQIEEKQ